MLWLGHDKVSAYGKCPLVEELYGVATKPQETNMWCTVQAMKDQIL